MSDKKLVWIMVGLVLLVLALGFIVVQVQGTPQSTTNNPQQGAATSPVPTPTYTTESPPTATVATGVAVFPTVTQQKPPVVQTGQTTNPVCNAQVTNTPCVQFASVQDAAVGNSYVNAVVHTSVNNGIVTIEDDVTNSKDALGNHDNSLNAIQLSCFNIQQGLWYMNSTINSDASQTIRKSNFREVDVTFTDQAKGGLFASCNLSSAGVDKIDKAGMWTDGDFTGAWALYDEATYS